jgi:hypothetical protein
MRCCELRPIRLACLILLVLCGAGGCGQSLSIKVIRVKQVLPSRAHPVTQARMDAKRAAKELAECLKMLNNITGGSADFLAKDKSRAEEIAHLLDQPLPICQVVMLADELLGMAAPVQSNRDLLVSLISPNDPSRAQRQQQFEDMMQRVVTLTQTIAMMRRDSLRLAEQIAYGGFHDNSVSRLDPYSSAYANLKSTDNAGEMEFANMNVELTGKTGLMLVQESPTHFERRAILSDPTEVIRNTLIVINKVLQVVSKFVPALSGVADAIPSGGVAGGGAGSGTGGDPASVAALAAHESLLRLAGDAEFLQALERVAGGTGNDVDRNSVLGKLAALRRELGVK